VVGEGITAGDEPTFVNNDTKKKFYVYNEDDEVTVGYVGVGIVEVMGMDADEFSADHTFTMPQEDVILTCNIFENSDFTLVNSSVDYNNEPQAPGINFDGDNFAEDNYTLTYLKDDEENPFNEIRNPGNYVVKELTGKRSYIGTVDINEGFVIYPSLVNATTLYAAGSTNQWMTWCGTEELITPEQVTVYTVSGIVNDDNNHCITLNDITGTASFGTQTMNVIPAYTPVLLYRENVTDDALEGMFNAEGEGESGVQMAEGTTGCAFYGTTEDLSDIPTDNYIDAQTYVLYGERFLLCKDNAGIGANKCWLVLNSANGSRQLAFSIGSDHTGIDEIRIENSSLRDLNGAWYSLDGRKLDSQPTKKGLYIYKGKKVVIK
jgi:hypothetical protein